MDQEQSQIKLLRNMFVHMWADSLESDTPPNAYKEMWNGVKDTSNESFYGVSNEPSNELTYN